MAMPVEARAAVEAKSLSTLTALASNPPSYPRDQSQPRNDPLVLYISRVPGSRDIFLTPIKPRQKVVSAEDVESSLYYLHVHGPEDERIIAAIEEPPDAVEGAESSVSRLFPKHSASHRKALPSLPAPPVPPVRGLNRVKPRSLPPYPLDDSPSAWSDPRASPISHALGIQRKPVAPVGLSIRPNNSNQHNIQAGQYSHPAALLPGRPSNPHNAQAPPVDNPYAPAMYQKPEQEMKPTFSTRPSIASQNHEPESAITLTLIRRDPASSAQWNVATITDPPVFEVMSNGRRNSGESTRIRKSGQALYIHVSTPGYAKFSDGQTPTPESSTPSLTTSLSVDDSVLTETTFHRRMWMEGSIFESRPQGHRKAVSSDNSLLSRPSFDARSSSDFSIDSSVAGLTQDQSMHSISINQERKRSRNRGYTLMSPWNGRCEFSSGMGNSLKCKHSLPIDGTTSSPITVSELRFNLPGGGPLASTVPTTPAPEAAKKRSRFLHPTRHLRLSSSMDSTRSKSDFGSSHEGSLLDLSLGQERAGGGFAGKQAKLGKLIIEDEGLKMMDLLVAANLALWWRAYEKG
ncbi:hypothetical protein EJ08DRAFT_691927 [Tothia fuscella]|uniref:Uncharacterized protein n=1 Tax=Tothia fuscella TaxID=1048955 RepID=A0A9P4P3M3_9PEZI|nr:hypothetical protein EJ08DRAFT_691927 [Tothia fuscella]